MIAVLFGMIMSIVHYFSEQIGIKFKKCSGELVSFSAGLSIAYIFLSLFPEFSYGVSQENRLLFVSILFGFAMLHLIEKYTYQHSPKAKILKKLALEDSAISFIYHFIIGMIIVSFFNKNFSDGLLFFVPVMFYTAVSTLPVDMTKSKIVKVILASSTTLGVLFSLFVYGSSMHRLAYLLLLGFIIGALCFTVIRHSLPKGKKGKPLFFIIGVIIYSIIIFLL